MIKACVVVNGRVENIGPWNYRYEIVDGVQVATNPFPIGGTIEMIDIVEDADGGLRPSADYYNLRKVAYPPITHQLDAIHKGGEDAAAMAAIIEGVKALYPKE